MTYETFFSIYAVCAFWGLVAISIFCDRANKKANSMMTDEEIEEHNRHWQRIPGDW